MLVRRDGDSDTRRGDASDVERERKEQWSRARNKVGAIFLHFSKEWKIKVPRRRSSGESHLSIFSSGSQSQST